MMKQLEELRRQQIEAEQLGECYADVLGEALDIAEKLYRYATDWNHPPEGNPDYKLWVKERKELGLPI